MARQPLAAATQPDRVHRLRAVAAAAARGESLLLGAELADPSRHTAQATANLATLAAFTLAYATGRPVPTVLTVPDATRGQVSRAQDRAEALGWLTEHRTVGSIARVESWLPKLSLTSRVTTDEAAFLAGMTKAWGFAVAYGGEPAAVARVLGSDRFLAWDSAASTHSRVVRHSATGDRYGLLSPGVLVEAEEPAEPLVNTAVLRLRPGTHADELARLCARLDPERATGKLVLLVPPMPDGRLSRCLDAVGEHRPAWVLGAGSGQRCGQRLVRMTDLLASHGVALGGVWLGGAGRRLEQVVRLATVLSARFAVPILDRTA